MADTNELALRIARLLEGEPPLGDASSIFASLEKINHRLEKLEKNAEHPGLQQMSQLPQMPLHPSQQRFDIAEAIADEVFGVQGKEKACTFEPNDKPCDHCSLCSSHGF